MLICTMYWTALYLIVQFIAAMKTDLAKMCKAYPKLLGSMSNLNHATINLHEC